MAKGNKAHKLLAAGTATLIAEPAMAFAHQGGLGIILGLVAGAVAYGIVDEVEQKTGGQLALPAVRTRQDDDEQVARAAGKPNFAQRLLVGKSVREAEAAAFTPEEDAIEDETVIVPEPGSEAEALSAQAQIGQQPRKPGQRVPALYGENPRRRLLLADNFQPDANPIARTGGIFSGVQGSGKTTSMVRTCEQYIKHWKLGGFFFDVKGIDFTTLVTSGFAERGLIVTQNNINALEERYAEHGGLVRTALHNQWQVVFNLPTWREPDRTAMSRRLVSQIMTSTINELMAEAAAIPPGTGQRRPFLIVIDEIQRFAPQNMQRDADLLDALVGLATTGRAAALTPFFACPRLAEVNKDLIGSMELRAFGQATLPQDIQTYRRHGVGPDFSDEEIRGLHTGEMIVCLGKQCVLVPFYNRDTPHGSHNASVDDALTGWERGKAPTMPPLAPNPLHHNEPAAPSQPVLAPQERPAPAGPRPTTPHATQGRHTESAAERALRLRNQAHTSREPLTFPVHQEEATNEEAPAKFTQEELNTACEQWYKGAGSIDKLRNRLETVYGQHVTHHYARKIAEELEKQGRIQLKRVGSPLVRANG